MIHSILEYIFQTLSQHHKGYPYFINKHCGKLCQIQIGRWSSTIQVHKSGILFCDIPTDNQIQIEDLLPLISLTDSSSNIQFQGDIGFCQDFSKLLSTQKIDIDGLVFAILPDTLAMISLEGLDMLKETLSHSKSQVVALLKDYLVHETGICIEKQESNALYERTQRLKWMIESLKKT